MDFKETLYKRASIRKFLDKDIPIEVLEELVHYGLRAPSAKNSRPWEFYIITNKKKMEDIKHVYTHASYNCAAMILVCGNKDRFLSGEGENFWIEDTSAAVENILLGAVSLGLGGIWIGTYPIKERMDGVKKELEIGDNIVPMALIELGYPSETNPRNIDEENKIHYVK